MTPSFAFVGYAAITLGALFTIINIIFLVRQIVNFKGAKKTIGIITNVESRPGMRKMDYHSTRNTLYKPTVRFQTDDGRIIDYTPQISASWNNYQVGDNVPVIYNPKQPEKAAIGTTAIRWLPYLVIGFIGGMFMMVGAFFAIFGENFPQ